LFFSSKEISDEEKMGYNANSYVYGYVTNIPFEVKEDHYFGGTLSNYLSDFELLFDVDFKTVRYENVSELKKAFSSGEVDLLFGNFNTSGVNVDRIITSSLFKENYVVVMGRDSHIPSLLLPYAVTHDELMSCNYQKEKKIRDMSVFRDVEFVYSPPNSNIYRKRRLVLDQPNVSSHVTSSTIIMQLSYNLAKAGFGAFFATDAILAAMQSDEQCLYFVIEDSSVKQCFKAVYNMENKESLSLTEDFIECARGLFDTDNPLMELS